jgi:hypothetical protein
MWNNIINTLKIILLKKTIGHCLYFFIGKFDVRKFIQLLGNYFFFKGPWWLLVLCTIAYKLYWYLYFFPYSLMILIGASLLYYFFIGQK